MCRTIFPRLLLFSEMCAIILYVELISRHGGDGLNRLLDKFAILLICMIGFGMSDSFAAPVASMLIAVTVSITVQLSTGKLLASLLILLSAASCAFVPVISCAMPLMLYDALWEKKWWLISPAVLAFMKLGALLPAQIIITAAGMIVAVIIFKRVSKLEETVGKLTQLRDEITEKNLQLSGQNTRLAEAQDTEVHLATLRERNRIAREIHDNVGHMLTRSLLQSGALIIINKDENLREPLQSLKDTLDTAMTSIRQSVHDLHDDSIDLKKLISDDLSTVEGRFKTDLDYDMSGNVPGNIKLCIAGVVKEGVSNAVKHSNGDKLKLVVREHPGFYQLMLEDNGRSGRIKETGIGLKNMEDRVRNVGGTISFNASEKGFRIFMSVPKKQGADYEDNSNR